MDFRTARPALAFQKQIREHRYQVKRGQSALAIGAMGRRVRNRFLFRHAQAHHIEKRPKDEPEQRNENRISQYHRNPLCFSLFLVIFCMQPHFSTGGFGVLFYFFIKKRMMDAFRGRKANERTFVCGILVLFAESARLFAEF